MCVRGDFNIYICLHCPSTTARGRWYKVPIYDTREEKQTMDNRKKETKKIALKRA